MTNEPKDTFGNPISFKKYLLARVIVSLITTIASYLIVSEHYQKIENSNLSLTMVVLSIIVIIITTGITIEAFWSYSKRDKNT